MQIVINISEDQMDMVRNSYKAIFCDVYSMMAEVIKKGTPLPKGHGNLIDTTEITAFSELECNGHSVESLDEFTTIIEADNEEKEE